MTSLHAIAPPSAGPPLGLNLAGIGPLSTEAVFRDAFKAAGPWRSYVRGRARDRLLYLASVRLGFTVRAAHLRSRVWAPRGEPHLDERGNIRSLASGQYAEALLWNEPGSRFPAGRFLCRYDGEGDLHFTGDLIVIGRKPGELTVELRPGTGQTVARVTRTDPNNPLRNIRLWPEGFDSGDEGQPFRPDFLGRWAGFRVFRFKDWQRADDLEAGDWLRRPTPDDQSQALKGVAPEYMIRLCNLLGVEPWFCMPCQASDDDVRRFAGLVKSGLNPSLRVHLEYGSECWNEHSAQGRYCLARGRKSGFGGSDCEARLQFYARRAVEVFALWEDVFGGRERLVRVLAASAADPQTSAIVLDCDEAWKRADALAIAAYFGRRWGNPTTVDEVAVLTPDQLIAALRVDLAWSAEQMRAHAAEARKRGLSLMAYEGGQHLAGEGGAENDERLTRLFAAVNRHPGMRELYQDHLRNWAEVGGGLFCHYSSVGAYGSWGCWGLLEHGAQPPDTAPKYQALAKPEPATGFRQRVPVAAETRLDWRFAASLLSPNAVKLPPFYESRDQRYQLFVPRGHDGREAGPLIVFISPDGEPAGWHCWQETCEGAGALCCAAVGAGNDCPVGQRTRIVLDMLDDVRRRYRVDPDQTYLAGFSGGGRMACSIAFALPEHFGGVVPICGTHPLPESADLRRRVCERLSVAFVTGEADFNRRENEAVMAPLFQELGVRSKLWVVPRLGHDLPPAGVLAEVYAWLAADLRRRREDTSARRLIPISDLHRIQ